MNWKLIVQLSVFGLIMAFATISLIPQKFEILFWLIIFIFCAYVIARVCLRSFFLHGFFVALLNCVWITAAHYFFYDMYVAHHPQVATMYASMPPSLATHPRAITAVSGIFAGIFSGLILGLFAFIASKIIKKPAPVVPDNV